MVPFCFEANNKPRAKIANEVIYCFYKIGVWLADLEESLFEGFFPT